MEIEDGPFTEAVHGESAVKRSIKEGRACGPDDIPPEIFQHCDLANIILAFAKKLLDEEKPEHWFRNDLIPLPKAGVQGVSLSGIAAKLVNKMILNRIRSKIDEHLPPNENGFRPGR